MNARPQKWIVVILWILALASAVNGVAMFFFPRAWFFDLVPGVTDTGPFNAHLVADGGTFNLALAAGLAFAARDPVRYAVAVVIAAVAGVMHSALHIYSHAAGMLSDHLGTEIFGIYLPAAILVVLSVMLTRQREPTTQGAHRAA